MKAQKLVHATRGQECVAERTNEPPCHAKHMSSRQALDTYESGACTRLRHHQPVPSQYRNGGPWAKGKRGYGLVVG